MDQQSPICIFALQYQMDRQFITQEPIQMYQAETTEDTQQLESRTVDANVYLGFNGRTFPLLGFVISVVSILWTYQVAVSKTPPDVKPFPWTDITHTAIHFPEYIIFRIGLMVAAPLFCISFQLLKNYLEIKCFEILGAPEKTLNSFGYLSILSCLFLCLSTATISDGGDMNWTAHTIGATGFFILALLLVTRSSKIYRKLWSAKKHFCPEFSYQIKKYSNFILGSILALQVGDMLKLFDIGSFVEWYATFYLMAFFLTLYWDLKGMEIVMFKV